MRYEEGVYEKAKKVRAMIDASDRDIRLEVDGGAGLKNIEKLASCGIDMFVVGRDGVSCVRYSNQRTPLSILKDLEEHLDAPKAPEAPEADCQYGENYAPEASPVRLTVRSARRRSI